MAEDERAQGPSQTSGDAAADIVLRGVTKRFGEQAAVDDLDLDIPEGSFFALLGPSGCGKTTTLRMIGGFEEPTEGTVLLGGVDVTNVPPHKRDVNTVFQSYALFPHMSVEKNVAFGLERKRVAKAEVKQRVAEALDLVELAPLARRKPAQMSGGQQQRVALARALVNRPRALLLDEPLGALDLRLRKQLQLELSHIQRDVGITFVHVTHDQEEAMSMADTIAVMRDGRIDQLGDAVELYDSPRTEFVANFLGSSNLIDASPTGRDGDVALVEADGAASLRVPAARLDAAGGGPVRIGVRPEKIALRAADAGAPSSNGLNVLLGHVTDASFLGVSTQYVVRTDGGADIQIFAQNAGTELEQIGPGRRVAATWTQPIRSSSARRPTMPNESLDLFFERIVAGEPISRRAALRRMAAAGLVVGSASSFLAACGGVRARQRRREHGDHPQPPEDGDRHGHVQQLAAVHRQGRHTAVAKQIDGKLKYVDDDNDNEEFFAKVRLELRPTSRSAATSSPRRTGWPRADRPRLCRADRQRNVPNAENLQDSLKSPPYDPDQQLHAAVAVGQNADRLQPAEDRQEAHELHEIFDPKYKGRVDVQRLASFRRAHASRYGEKPTTASKDDYKEAIEKIDEESRNGQIRRFTGNDYTKTSRPGRGVRRLVRRPRAASVPPTRTFSSWCRRRAA